MRRIIALSLLVAFFSAIASLDTDAQRNSNTQHKRSRRKPPQTESESEGLNCPAAIADCPPEGCGKQADSKLNTAKNRFDAPDDQNVNDMTLNQIKRLKQPASWPLNKDRTSLQVPGKEGTAVRVKGFLWRAKKEGAESCNCGILGVNNTDIHLVLVSNPNDDESTSITVEMTPRVRQRNNHPNWTYGKVNDFENDYVRVTGWLLLDTKHISNPLVRATNWEVHPILKFEHCTKAKSTCDRGTGWEEF